MQLLSVNESNTHLIVPSERRHVAGHIVCVRVGLNAATH